MIRLLVVGVLLILLSGCCSQRPLVEVDRTLNQVESITYTIDRLDRRY